MYALLDTFNDKIVSRHRTVEAVAKAKAKFLRQVEAANGPGSYLPVECRRIEGGSLVELTDSEADDFLEAENRET
jgi:hypothetical protein